MNDNIYFLLLLGERSSGAMQMDSRDSLGWHLIEMAGTSYIPWRSTPMYMVLGTGHYGSVWIEPIVAETENWKLKALKQNNF